MDSTKLFLHKPSDSGGLASAWRFLATFAGRLGLGLTLVLLTACHFDAGKSTVPTQPVITAADTVSSGDTALAASVPLEAGCTYAWTITGGTFTGNAATATGTEVTFTAGSIGTLTLSCTAKTASGQLSLVGTKSINVVIAPTITKFVGNPISIAPGGSAQLLADFADGTGVVTPGNLTITSGVPATPLTVSPLVTTTYTLTVTGPGSSVTRTTTIAVVDGITSNTVRETGKISLSIDGLGTMNDTGIIQVEKPAGATVRKAYLASTSVGGSERILADGDVTIDGAGVVWDLGMPSSINNGGNYIHWSDVTAMVKAKIDAAPAGRVDFTIGEVRSSSIDGEILAVIFDDPNQLQNNTVLLMFGPLKSTGDTVTLNLGAPLDKTDPALLIDMSLGISYGYQETGGGQFSQVDINGVRLTSSAGGSDDADGEANDGNLLTVGGLDDSHDNPADPNAGPTNARTDDELYNLLPFMANGDTSITVYVNNPSLDDNVFFLAFNMKSTTATVAPAVTAAAVKTQALPKAKTKSGIPGMN